MSFSEDSLWMRIVRGDARTPRERATAAALRLLSVVYGGALRLHLAGYRLGVARRTRFPALVVSVGNLTVGGTGKTTASVAVAKWLSEHGRRVAYLSRGYRGAGERRSLIVSEGFGPLLPADISGDEPFMIARALPEVFVLVGKDRRRTGALALEKFGIDAMVLDDGFQYQRLARDINVVLVDALMPFGYDFLVPRGLLREPPSHLARADAIWITHSDLVRRNDLQAIRERVERLAPHARIWETVHQPVRLRSLVVDDVIELDALGGRKICALSSLGNPLAFERSLERLGAELTARVRFPDHHAYRADELRATLDDQANGAEWIVTTEKDAVRIPEEALNRPSWALDVELAGRPGAPDLSEVLLCLLRGKSAT
jgi:tetraacyldisaccharide 4'-kinase